MAAGKNRNWFKMHKTWFRDPVLEACAAEQPACLALWPILCGMAKEQSHVEDNPDGIITTSIAQLSRAAFVSREAAEDCLSLFVEGEMLKLEREERKVFVTLGGFAKWNHPNGSTADRKTISRGFVSKRHGSVTSGHKVSHIGHTDRDRDRDKELKKEVLSTNPVDESVEEVMTHWASVWKKNQNMLKGAAQQERRAKIKARLNAGYSVEEIKNAITGYTYSPHHNGSNGKRYDDLVTLLRNNTQVDKGLDWYQQSGAALDASNTDEYIDQVLRGGA